jgi:hypothetical protein
VNIGNYANLKMNTEAIVEGVVLALSYPGHLCWFVVRSFHMCLGSYLGVEDGKEIPSRQGNQLYSYL